MTKPIREMIDSELQTEVKVYRKDNLHSYRRDLILQEMGRRVAEEISSAPPPEREKFPQVIELKDLRLADVVELFEGPFGTAVVTQITADEVTMHRPYGVTSEWSYTGGVPYSVGNEVVKYLLSSRPGHYKFKVWQRKDLK